MTCPKCQGQLRQYERNGVTVDMCAECRGIFLDRGELERLIDAESTWVAQRAQPAQPPPTYQQPADRARYRDHDSDEYPAYGHGAQGHPRRKRRGFLSELFD